MDQVTLQELFDGQATFAPKDVGLILAFQNLWSNHKKSTGLDEWPAAYYNDLSNIAHEYGVEYTAPKHLGKLSEVKGVGSPTALH